MSSVTDVEPIPMIPNKGRLYLGWRINSQGQPEQTRRWMLNGRWINPLAVVERDDPILVGEGFELNLNNGLLTKLHQGDEAKIIPSTHTVYGDLMSVSLKSGDHFVLFKEQSVVLWVEEAHLAESLAQALANGEYDPREHFTITFANRDGKFGDNFSFTAHGSFIDVFYSTKYLGSVKEATQGDGGIRGFKNPGSYDPSSAVRVCAALARAEYNPLMGTSKKYYVPSRSEKYLAEEDAWLKKVDAAINAR